MYVISCAEKCQSKILCLITLQIESIAVWFILRALQREGTMALVIIPVEFQCQLVSYWGDTIPACFTVVLLYYFNFLYDI